MLREGVLWAWGSNDYGELGDGTTIERPIPFPVRAPSDIVAVDAGPQSVHVVRGDGTVWGWGYNIDGKLGDGTEESRMTPVQVKGLSDVVAVAAWDACYALLADGSVWAWGSNNGGQLGDGTQNPRSTPARVEGLPRALAVTASGGTGFALGAGGTVWAWGHDGYGQFGGAESRNDHGPVEVLRFDAGRDTKLSGVTAICAGIFSGYALRNDGTVWSWGANDVGQLGNGSTVNATENLLASMTRHNAASPVRGLSDVVAISSKGVTAYALRSDGTVWAWGSNKYGQLGAGSVLAYSVVPMQVIGLREVIAISSNGDSAYALRSDGTVWAWGENDFGELGDGTHEHRSRPVQVVGLSGVTGIAAGIIAAYALVDQSHTDTRGMSSNRSRSEVRSDKATPSEQQTARGLHDSARRNEIDPDTELAMWVFNARLPAEGYARFYNRLVSAARQGPESSAATVDGLDHAACRCTVNFLIGCDRSADPLAFKSVGAHIRQLPLAGPDERGTLGDLLTTYNELLSIARGGGGAASEPVAARLTHNEVRQLLAYLIAYDASNPPPTHAMAMYGTQAMDHNRGPFLFT